MSCCGWGVGVSGVALGVYRKISDCKGEPKQIPMAWTSSGCVGRTTAGPTRDASRPFCARGAGSSQRAVIGMPATHSCRDTHASWSGEHAGRRTLPRSAVGLTVARTPRAGPLIGRIKDSFWDARNSTGAFPP